MPTGHETLIALGSLSRLPCVAGRRVVLCRDDDRQHSPADKALIRTLACWRKAGIGVVVASPWPERRWDRSDFNDLIRQSGSSAVRDRIDAALRPGPTPPRRLLAQEGRRLANEAVNAFFRDAKEWWVRQDPAHLPPSGEPKRDNDPNHGLFPGDGPAETDGPPVQLVQIDVGGGKSDAARSASAQFLAELRRNGDNRTVAIAVPTHTR